MFKRNLIERPVKEFNMNNAYYTYFRIIVKITMLIKYLNWKYTVSCSHIAY